MTKNYKNELSQNAKAFSVESLLTLENVEDRALEKKLKKTLIINSKIQIKNGIRVELCCDHLWEKFNRLGTEMIVTRAGSFQNVIKPGEAPNILLFANMNNATATHSIDLEKFWIILITRMFPTLKVRFFGLKYTATYIVYMDVFLAGATRYRYNFQRNEWTAVGPSSNSTLNNIYVHPSSPAKGEVWMSQGNISFDKVKLTNNKKPIMKDQVSLHSMHKYQPRIHILEIPTGVKPLTSQNLSECIQQYSERSEIFIFEQTTFIAVTAYQNQKIINLKIQNNPFAKAFREISKSRRRQQRPLTNETHISMPTVYSTEENPGRSVGSAETKPSE